MRRILGGIALLGALAIAAGAGGLRVAGPVARLDPATVDLGVLPQGAIRKVDVTLHNDGSAELQILKVESDCGCTVPRLADSLLSPGETAVLSVTLSTRTFSGQIAKHVFLQTNDPASPRAALTLTAEVRVPLTCRPTTIDFGAVPRGTAVLDTIRIKVGPGETFALESLAFPAALVTTETRSTTEGDSLVQEIRVRLRPDAPAGPIRATAHIYTNHPAARDLSIQLTGQVIGAFQIEPVSFGFGQFRQGTARERSVRLTARGGPHRVLGAVCTDARLSATVRTIAEGETYEVVLTLPGDLPRGEVRAEVKIATDDPGQREITLPVTGLVRRGSA
jgi:hypothetical protein